MESFVRETGVISVAPQKAYLKVAQRPHFSWGDPETGHVV